MRYLGRYSLSVLGCFFNHYTLAVGLLAVAVRASMPATCPCLLGLGERVRAHSACLVARDERHVLVHVPLLAIDGVLPA